MTPNSSDQEKWQIVEQNFKHEDALINETLFALGNGYLGMRGTFEEGLGRAALEGTYVNGFYESAPIIYGEKFQGFAENKQTILNLANAKVIRFWIGDNSDGAGEEFSLLTGKILTYRRTLDLREGVLRRILLWESPQGKRVQLDIERLVLHTHPHIALIRYRLTSLNFDGPLTLFSGIDGAIRQSEHAEDDPRLGTQFSGDVFHLEEQTVTNDTAFMLHRTITTQFTVACGIRNLLDSPCSCEAYKDDHLIGFTYKLDVHRGLPVTLNKFMVYVTTQDTELTRVVPTALSELEEAVTTGYDALCKEQNDYLANFWDVADIVIEGDDALQRGIRFNMFHLLQSTGKDGRTNIAAKGLTGLGYEGHYFWDTEIYILPFFLYTQPEISRKLVEYRYHILDKARERAREMAHSRGALYPWRTINGEECSANFPTGTAQYHMNADIAFAIQRYYDATEDDVFMKQYGAEILCETARLWIDVGDFIASRGNHFVLTASPDRMNIRSSSIIMLTRT